MYSLPIFYHYTQMPARQRRKVAHFHYTMLWAGLHFEQSRLLSPCIQMVPRLETSQRSFHYTMHVNLLVQMHLKGVACVTGKGMTPLQIVTEN
jgi:hypothetical protein